jgi:soluble cytochrome b562
MSSKEQVDFFTQLSELEDALETARGKLGAKGQSSPDALAEYAAASQAMADWRRGIKLLAGRPDIVDAPTGVN